MAGEEGGAEVEDSHSKDGTAKEEVEGGRV